MKRKLLPLGLFTAAFALLATYLFWGTWSLDVSPVMPDDASLGSLAYGDVIRSALVDFVKSGLIQPSDLLWKGLLISPSFCKELKYASSLYFAGLALAFFLRGRGLGNLAAYGAGLLLSFCGYWCTLFSAGHGGWFIWMTYGVFAFGLIDRALEKGRLGHWLLLGLAVAWGSFHQPDLWLLFTLLTGAYFIFRLVVVLREKTCPLSNRELIRAFVLSAVAFFAVGAPSFRTAIMEALPGRDAQIASGATVPKTSQNSGEKADTKAEREKRWIFVTNWSLPIDETAEFLVSRLNGDTSCPITLGLGGRLTGVRPYTGALGRPINARQGNYRQHSLYVGWVTCLLAIVGALWAFGAFQKAEGSADNRRIVKFFLFAGILTYLFSLGRNCELIYRLVFALPMGDYLRAPVKWHHLTELSIVVLAGFGLAALERLCKTKVAKVALLAALVYGVCDLVRVDGLYCAPQQNYYQLQLASAAQVDSSRARAALAQQNIRVLGSANGIAVLGRYQRPQPYTEKIPPVGLPAIFGFLSLIASLTVVVFSFFNLNRERTGA